MVDAVAGLLVLVHQKLHLKYGAAAARDQDTVVSVVVVILLVVDRLADTLVEKLFEEQMDSLFQDVVIDSA